MPESLLDRVTSWMRKDAIKHDLWQKYSDPQEYVRAKIDAMSNYELLEAISNALEDA